MRSRNRETFEKSGDLHFVTSTIVGHVNLFSCPPLYEILIDNLRFYQDRGDIVLLAYVLMPNHFHLIIKTARDNTISSCVANFKRITSRQISMYLKETAKFEIISQLTVAAKAEPARDSRIWKPRFDNLVLVSETVLRQKIDYIHFNPVKKGLVPNPVDWPYSSARNYAKHPNLLLDVDNEWRSLGY